MFSIALNPWQCEAYVIQNEEVLPDLASFQPTLHACAIKTFLTSELLKTTRKKQLWNPLKNTVHVIYGHTCGQIKVFQIRQYAQSFDTSHRLPRTDCLAGVFNEIIMCAFRVRFPKPKYSNISSCCCSQKKTTFSTCMVAIVLLHVKHAGFRRYVSCCTNKKNTSTGHNTAFNKYINTIVLWVQMPIKLMDWWMLAHTDNTCILVLLTRSY